MKRARRPANLARRTWGPSPGKAEELVAVLSCGPSLAYTYRPGCSYHQIVAVNSAASRYPAHTFVFGDVLTWKRWPPISPARPFLRAEHAYALEHVAGPSKWEGELLVWEAIETPGLRVEHWRAFSSTAALVYAGTRHGVRVVDVYGADMAGEVDHCGTWAMRRDAERWGQERRFWRYVVEWLERAGVTVRRVGFEHEEVEP